MHRVRIAFSQVKALSCLRPGSGIPSISTAYAQARRRCAQVIHMFVHRQQEGSPVAWPADSSRSARRCLRPRPARRMRGSGRVYGTLPGFVPGVMLVAGNRHARAVVRVMAVDQDGQVHFAVLPGSLEKNRHLIGLALA